MPYEKLHIFQYMLWHAVSRPVLNGAIVTPTSEVCMTTIFIEGSKFRSEKFVWPLVA
jgi:hypothetical protein